MSHVKCCAPRVKFFVSGGSVINGAYPVYCIYKVLAIHRYLNILWSNTDVTRHPSKWVSDKTQQIVCFEGMGLDSRPQHSNFSALCRVEPPWVSPVRRFL